jgi:hypothetical protein
MKFMLKEATMEVREQTVRVRELTHSERLQWVRAISEDKFRGPQLLVSLGSLEPKFSEEEAGDLPSDVVQAIVDKVLNLSGLDKKGTTDSKQTDAGAAVPLQTSSGVGQTAE